MKDPKRKMYIVPLKFNTWRKRLYFEGEDNEDFKEKFRKACIDLNEVGDNAENYSEFLAKTIELFQSYGFTRIPK